MPIQDFLNINPTMQYLPDFDMKPHTPWHGVRAFCYDGANYKGQKTKIFAQIGYPEAAKANTKVPAVVLVHGGGGHAFAEWIKRWNAQGFAAIAMDTIGYFPAEDQKGVLGTELADWKGLYTKKLYGDLDQPGYTLGPDNTDMADMDMPMEDQWIYHAIAATVLAHNILLNDPNINKDCIGICGISYGGIVTSLAIGFDTRYAFAIPIYGSGYLDYEPCPALPHYFQQPVAKKLWRAADRFSNVAFPTLWKCWAYDRCFSIGGNSLSYLATKKHGAVLSVDLDWGHSHIHGWRATEPYRFAKGIANQKLPLIRVVDEPVGFSNIAFAIEIPEDFQKISARLCYLTQPMEYNAENKMIRTWKWIDACVSNNTVTAQVPADACCYYVEISGEADGTRYTSTTALIEKA